MATLTDEIKLFIVKALACFDTPTEIVAAVKDTFGVEITRQQVQGYDPRCTRPPAERWRAIHAATRAAYLQEVAEIGVAQKPVRLGMLARMIRRCEESGYTMRTAVLLEQVARECGGAYERVRPAAPPPHDGAPPPPSETPDDIADDDAASPPISGDPAATHVGDPLQDSAWNEVRASEPPPGAQPRRGFSSAQVERRTADGPGQIRTRSLATLAAALAATAARCLGQLAGQEARSCLSLRRLPNSMRRSSCARCAA